MINGKDIYEVLSALVPLYVAMILAYGSVCWWKMFTRDQCSGINRFVAVFAIPLLSFHFISTNNPYAMNFRFIIADSLQKVAILLLLFAWNFTKFGNIDWLVTFFSLSTLPNTLVMGVPLLRAMYGDHSADLMIQIVVLQSVVWNTVLIILFEYRGAKTLISEQFSHDIVKSVASVEVESDVFSLSSRLALHAEAEMRSDGKFRLVVRRSDSSSRSVDSMEMYSLPSSRESTPRVLSFKEGSFYPMYSKKVADQRNGCKRVNEDKVMRSGKEYRKANSFPNSHPVPNPTVSGLVIDSVKETGANSNLHMFDWSSSSPACPEGEIKHAVSKNASTNSRDNNFSMSAQKNADSTGNNISNHHASPMKKSGRNGKVDVEDGHKRSDLKISVAETGEGDQGNDSHAMPSATVVSRLIIIMVWRKLIRNPNTYGSLLGLVWSLISFRWDVGLPEIIGGSVTILSNTGVGMAMFSLGHYMALQPKIITCGKKMALFSMSIRFLVGPIVIAITSVAIGLRGDLLRISILQAALPQAIVPFVFAMEYDCHADILSTGVIFGMIIALPITIIYYILLGLKI